jgi:hypothetical protein
MDIKQYFKAENEVPNSGEEHTSPSGRYVLKTSEYNTVEGAGSVSRGLVYRAADLQTPLFDVQRNYGLFPFCFVEDHPNGHDYMVCGADYQGQTILELDTGKKVDYLPEGEKHGVGFCWAKYTASIEKDVLGVEGCFWACPYELRFVDFSEPMNPPFLVLAEFSCIDDDTALDTQWSAIAGIEFVSSGKEDDDKQKRIWKKENPAEVAAYWQSELAKVKPDSYFYADIKTQADLSTKKQR